MTDPTRLIIVRFSEIGLKGRNRGMFLRSLIENLQASVEPLDGVEVRRRKTRIEVHGGYPEEVLPRVASVPGVSSASVATSVEGTLEAIERAVCAAMDDELSQHAPDLPVRFRVSVRRANKAFPMESPQLQHHLGQMLRHRFSQLVVNLEQPQIDIGIDLRGKANYIFANQVRGPGGLPVGTLGKAICLLSGGIDSPVAAYLGMKRGLEVHCISFHSSPFLGESSREKIRDLVRVLTRYQAVIRFWSLPFTKVQIAIRDGAPEGYRTVLYRRQMHRLAVSVAHREGALSLLTGESLGQVASQTLENMRAIGAAATLPVLQPLITYNKEETVALARRIGTYDVSVRPEPDCCTVFQPRRPIIRGRVSACEEIEKTIELAPLLDASLEQAEVESFRCR